MGNEEPAAIPDQEEKIAVPRPMSRRRKKKMVVAIVVIVAALAVVLWGWSSTGGSFVSISSVANNPSVYAGKSIEIRGVVSGWNGDPSSRNFTLYDTDASMNKSLSVTMTGALPSGFENGKTVTAKGQLDGVQSLHFTATDLAVGCASKY